MKIRKIPQVQREIVAVEVAAKHEKLAITSDGESRIYDFSALELGQFLETMDDYIMSAVREDDGIHIDILWPIDANASEEDRYPPPEILEEAAKLPDGEEVKLIFAWPQKPEPSAEAQLVVGLMQGLLASDTKAVSDDFIMRAAGVYEFPEYAVGQNYKKGEIIQQDGIFFEVLSEHQSLKNWPPKSTGSVYRAISVSTDPDAGTLENPIPYPEDVQSVAVENGKYYSYKGKIYLAKADMPVCVWPPGSAGVWQWEEVT